MKNSLLLIIVAFLLFGCTAAPPAGAQEQNGATQAYAPLALACPNSTASIGNPYSGIPIASGGTGIYTLTASGSLPPGLVMSGGMVSGQPQVTGEYPFSLTVADSNGNSAAQQCSILVSQAYFQCSITKAVYYTRPMCQQACLGLQDDCQAFAPVPPRDNLNILLGFCFLGSVIVLAILIVFRDSIAAWWFPETDRSRTLRPSVYLEEDGSFHNRANFVRRDREGNLSYILTDKSRPSDKHHIDSREYYFTIDSLFKWGANPKLRRFDRALRVALDDLARVNAENNALRESARRTVGQDILGAVKEISYTLGEIGKNVHPQPVFNPQRRGAGGGEGVSYGGEGPPYQE